MISTPQSQYSARIYYYSVLSSSTFTIGVIQSKIYFIAEIYDSTLGYYQKYTPN